MKFTILLSSAILFATALTPISAYADDSNLKCRRMASGCDTRNNDGNERISISGFDIEVKSSDRGNRNRNTGNRNTAARNKDNIGNGNDDTVSAAGADHADADDTDNTDAGNENADTVGNNTDTGGGTGGGNNTNPPQHNSNDIKGYDPFTDGLYGPGT
jgi:hypothetical protein